MMTFKAPRFLPGMTSALIIYFALSGPVSGNNSLYTTAPVVPVSTANKTYSGDRAYFTFFQPNCSGRWNGNLKRYDLDPKTGNIHDIDPITGEIRKNSRSAWSNTIDGGDILAGGVGAELLKDLNSRIVITNLGVTTTLMDVTNRFAVANEVLTAAMLGLTSESARQTLIENIIGTGREFAETETPWVMGDIIHSGPAVARLGRKSYIFVGANDGMMHCFRDDDGSEVWAFIPNDLLSRLKLLIDEVPVHEYYVDGVPTVFGLGNDRILFFGEGRGGPFYHAIQVTDPAAPVYRFSVGPTMIGKNTEQLGQSWGRPLIGVIKTHASKSKKVVILPGGYDTNQDSIAPAEYDNRGRAVFAVGASNGELESSFAFYNDAISNTDMTHSIVDVSGADTNGDGFLDRIYAGDMKGQIFAFEDDDGDGRWKKRLLFRSSEPGQRRKVFGAPDIVAISPLQGGSGSTALGDMIFFGTGDQVHATTDNVTNRFFAVKNYWDATCRELDADTVLDGENAFCNATGYGTPKWNTSREEAFRDCLSKPQNRGWYFDLGTQDNPGEQIVGSPMVYDGVVYFTTYSPPVVEPVNASSGAAVSLQTSNTGGEGRLYAVDARTAKPAVSFKPVKQGDENTHDSRKHDEMSRNTLISNSRPSELTIVVSKDTASLLVRTMDAILQFDTAERPDLHMYYWRDLKN